MANPRATIIPARAILVVLAYCHRLTVGQPVAQPAAITPSVDPKLIAKVDALRAEQGVKAQGTAICVDAAGKFATALHLVRGADAIQVTLSNGRSVRAQVIGWNEAADVAVFQLQLKSSPEMALSTDLPTIGQPVWALGRDGTPRAGKVLRLDDRGDGIAEIATDAPFKEGDSGGGLIDAKGRLIGVLLGLGEHGRMAVGTEAVHSNASP